jgi:hypothetical protein
MLQGQVKSKAQLNGKMSYNRIRSCGRNKDGEPVYNVDDVLELFGLYLDAFGAVVAWTPPATAQEASTETPTEASEDAPEDAPVVTHPDDANVATDAQEDARTYTQAAAPVKGQNKQEAPVSQETPESLEVFVVKPFDDAITGQRFGYGDIARLTFERVRELNTHPFGPFVWEPKQGMYGVIKGFSHLNKWYDVGAIISAEELRYADDVIMSRVWKGGADERI